MTTPAASVGMPLSAVDTPALLLDLGAFERNVARAADAVVDAGLKSLAFDSGMPGDWQLPGVEYVNESDEHGVLAIAPGAPGPALGDKLLSVPGHCDPTVNLHDWFVCVRRGTVEALWPVSARGASR